MVPDCINFDQRQMKSCFPEHNTYRRQARYNSISLERDGESTLYSVICDNKINNFS